MRRLKVSRKIVVVTAGSLRNSKDQSAGNRLAADSIEGSVEIFISMLDACRSGQRFVGIILILKDPMAKRSNFHLSNYFGAGADK